MPYFFVPIFKPCIWPAYIRKKYSYTDHLTFGFHNTALLFILLYVSYFIVVIFDVDSNWIFPTIFSIYLCWVMKQFYDWNVFKTIVKYLFLNVIFYILAGFSMLPLFATHFFTY